ncbi:MAG: hypothetical protein RTU63_13405, partial [Candidatus Thorarchaeota archaeon]
GSCFIEAASSRSRKTHKTVLRPLHGRLTSRPTGGDGRRSYGLGSRLKLYLHPLIPAQRI